MIEEIIVYRGVFSEGILNATVIGFYSGCDEIETISQLRARLGDGEIIEALFGEQIDAEIWEESKLYEKYYDALRTGQDNELFRKLYKVSDNYAVSIEEHTFLYHITSIVIDGDNGKMFPWYTICSKHDISDTWWEKDEEIISDMKNLSFIRYVEKYRMFRE